VFRLWWYQVLQYHLQICITLLFWCSILSISMVHKSTSSKKVILLILQSWNITIIVFVWCYKWYVKFSATTILNYVMNCKSNSDFDVFNFKEKEALTFDWWGSGRQFSHLSGMELSLHIQYGYHQSWQSHHPIMERFI
jgi:hypothetical protein